MKITRRHLGLGTLGAALSAFVVGAGDTPRRRFLFVHAEGGWDPLAVFAPLYDAPNIDMEPGTQPVSVGGFSLVDSAARPSVPAFFEKWGDRTLLLNGLSTRSVNHETCQAVALTGSTSDSGTDWATLLAASLLDDYFLPHLVLNGPSFAGDKTIAVSRAEGLVQDAIHGSLLEEADQPFDPLSDSTTPAIDAFLRERANAMVTGQQSERSRAFADQLSLAMSRSQQLVDARDLVQVGYSPTLSGRAEAAIRLLASGVTRCGTVSTEFLWDTHADNSEQSPLFQDFFTQLDIILETLGQHSDAAGVPVSEDTVVVVLSEMGRTPAYNGTQGRDHWPYTSAMIIGNGVTGGRTAGGYTDLYAGVGIDPQSGELDDNRAGIDAAELGATLLALGDLNPGEHLTSPVVLEGLLT